MKRILFFVLFVFFISSTGKSAVFELTINNPNYKPTSIGLWGFKADKKDVEIADKIKKIIIKDLNISGFFSIGSSQMFSIDTPHNIVENLAALYKFDYAIYGNIYKNRGYVYINFKIVDSINKKILLNQSLSSNIASYKWLAHKVADEFMKYSTGKYGPFESRLAFSEGKGKIRDMYISDFDGESIVRLTNWHTMNIIPKWIDKNHITFVSYKNGKPAIFLADILNGKVRKLFSKSNLSVSAVKYRNHFAVTFSNGGYVNIFETNRHGHILRKLTNSYSINVSPSFTKDYSEMFFVSNRSGNPQIYMKNMDISSSPIKITHNGKYNSSPAISSDNKWLAYISLHDGESFLNVMHLDGSANQTILSGYSLDSLSFSCNSDFVVLTGEINGKRGVYIINILNGHYYLVTKNNNMYNGVSVSGYLE